MKSDPVSELRRECEAVLAQLERLRAIKVKAAGELLDMSEEQVRALFPIKVFGPKTHRVALSDIEAFQAKRTLFPAAISKESSVKKHAAGRNAGKNEGQAAA